MHQQLLRLQREAHSHLHQRKAAKLKDIGAQPGLQ